MLFDLPAEIRVEIVGRLTDWNDILSFSFASKACYELASEAVTRIERWSRRDRESQAWWKQRTSFSVEWLERFRNLECCRVPVSCSGIVDTYKVSRLALRETAIDLCLRTDLRVVVGDFIGSMATHREQASSIIMYSQVHDLHVSLYREQRSGTNRTDAIVRSKSESGRAGSDFDLTIVSRELTIAKLRTTPTSMKLLVQSIDNVRYAYPHLELFATRLEGNGGPVKLGVTDVFVEDAKEELAGKVESLTVYSGGGYDADEDDDVNWDFKPFVSLRRLVFKGKCRNVKALYQSLPGKAEVYFRCVVPFEWIWELASLPCVKEVWCKFQHKERIQERGQCDPVAAEKIRYGTHPSYAKNLRRGTY